MAAAAGREAACEEEGAGGRRPLPLPSARSIQAGSASSALRGEEGRPRLREIGHEWAFGDGEVKGDEVAPAGLNWVREYFGKVWWTGGSR